VVCVITSDQNIAQVACVHAKLAVDSSHEIAAADTHSTAQHLCATSDTQQHVVLSHAPDYVHNVNRTFAAESHCTLQTLSLLVAKLYKPITT
jgi:hypothetical protein